MGHMTRWSIYTGGISSCRGEDWIPTVRPTLLLPSPPMQRSERSHRTTTGGVSRVGKRGHRLGCGDMQELAGGASPRIGDGRNSRRTVSWAAEWHRENRRWEE